MLDIKITILSINYEASLSNLLPAAFEKCKNMPQGSGTIRFIQELNNVSEDNMYRILKCIPKELYDRLLCIISRLFSNEITRNLNAALQKQLPSGIIKINEILLNQEVTGELSLYINNIETDYTSLVNFSSGKVNDGIISWILKTIVPVLSKIPPDKQESGVVSFLHNGFVKKGLESMAEKSLLNNGIILKLGEIAISQAEDNIINYIELEKLEEVEEDFLNILASLLKPLG